MAPSGTSGARDEPLPPPTPLVGRLARAQANFFETFPLMIAAVLIVSAAGLTSRETALGAWLWLGARDRLSAALRDRRAGGAHRSPGRPRWSGSIMILWPALRAAF